jgi:5-methylcytosine-specific restriction enzyme A
MNTYLLAWNPNRWKWVELSDEADQTAAGTIVTGRWSCGNTKKIQKGDRVFLIRLGVEPKGIMGSGWVSEDATLAEAQLALKHCRSLRAEVRRNLGLKK